MDDLIEKAKSFATQRHKDTVRKFEGTPYITHPIAVAERLKEFTSDPHIIASAYLHDLIEDTHTSPNEIELFFGVAIKNLVMELTSDKKIANKIGKALYLTDKINKMSIKARLIKLADREHNVSNLSNTSKDFSLRYAKETEYILEHLNFTPTLDEKKLIESIWAKINPILKKSK